VFAVQDQAATFFHQPKTIGLVGVAGKGVVNSLCVHKFKAAALSFPSEALKFGFGLTARQLAPRCAVFVMRLLSYIVLKNLAMRRL
jgi:hypothetical protein